MTSVVFFAWMGHWFAVKRVFLSSDNLFASFAPLHLGVRINPIMFNLNAPESKPGSLNTGYIYSCCIFRLNINKVEVILWWRIPHR